MSVESLVPRFLRIHKARINRYWAWPEHTNRETELVLIKKGRMRCSIDHIGFVGRDSDLYFVQPGQLHCEEILGEYLDIFTLRFDLGGYPLNASTPYMLCFLPTICRYGNGDVKTACCIRR